MSNSNQRDIPVAYPLPTATQQKYDMEPPPIGYPMKDGYDQAGEFRYHVPAETSSRGEGFWKGCVAAICCCWVLDFCFGC